MKNFSQTAKKARSGENFLRNFWFFSIFLGNFWLKIVIKQQRGGGDWANAYKFQ